MMLTVKELQELTGAKQKVKVCRWLTENRYPYDVGADGWPRVLRSYLEQRLGGTMPASREPRLRLA